MYFLTRALPLAKERADGDEVQRVPDPPAVRLQVILLQLEPVQGSLRRLVRRVRLFVSFLATKARPAAGERAREGCDICLRLQQ